MSALSQFLSRPARTLTLARAQRLYDRFLGRSGAPRYRIVHVAGTNGKGSVAGKLQACLSGVGYRVGLYQSPHIWSVHDRITINQEPISDPDLQHYLHEIRVRHDQDEDPITTFEALTITALQYFQDQQVDFAVVEAGLGGALDATNVVQPDVSVITSIGYDHSEHLGETIDEITRHKGGIIKAKTPIVTGPTVPHHLITSMAKRLDAPHHHVQYDLHTRSSYDLENIAITTRVLDLLRVRYDPDHLRYVPPCRFQTFTHRARTVVLDAAHNKAAFVALIQRLRSMPVLAQGTGRLHLIVGMSSNKMQPSDVIETFAELNPAAVYIVAASGNSRAWDPVQVAVRAQAASINPDLVRCLAGGNIGATLDQVVLGSSPTDVIVVCGSFYIMREAQEALDLVAPHPYSLDDIAAMHDNCIQARINQSGSTP